MSTSNKANATCFSPFKGTVGLVSRGARKLACARVIAKENKTQLVVLSCKNKVPYFKLLCVLIQEINKFRFKHNRKRLIPTEIWKLNPILALKYVKIKFKS